MSSTPSPLVSTAELAERLAGERPPVLLDVRWRLGGPPGRVDYERGHLPGAVFVDLDTELAAPPGAGGRHPLPDPDTFQVVLRTAGIRSNDRVVAYDAGDGSVAARVWWLLRWAGHAEVAVLNGGYAAWTAEDRPVTTDLPTPTPGDIHICPGGMPVLDADQAAELAATGVLLDARAPERYRGEVEPVDPRAGHVPGARNSPYTGQVGPDGRWLGRAELAARFAGIEVAEGAAVGVYCGSGVTAASVVLALEVAGMTDPAAPASLYAGSWSEWSSDPSRPVATGDSPAGD